MKTRTWTRQINGYRWELRQFATLGLNENCRIFAVPQKRFILDTGRVEYHSVGPKARFDSIEARDRFLASFTAHEWAQPAQGVK